MPALIGSLLPSLLRPTEVQRTEDGASRSLGCCVLLIGSVVLAFLLDSGSIESAEIVLRDTPMPHVHCFFANQVIAGRPESKEEGRMAASNKEIFCCFGVDVDAVAGWLGSYGGEDSPCDITRGLFAGEIGTPRLLELFDRSGIRTTWFIPGHSIETFPQADADGRRRRTRDRPARLLPREPGRHDAGAGRGRPQQVDRPHRATSAACAPAATSPPGGS